MYNSTPIRCNIYGLVTNRLDGMQMCIVYCISKSAVDTYHKQFTHSGANNKVSLTLNVDTLVLAAVHGLF